jgi:hypothetical protein
MQIEGLKEILSLGTGIIAVLGFLGAIWRKITKTLKIVSDKNNQLEKLPGMVESINKKLDVMSETDTIQGERMDKIEEDLVRNERDRLKHVIFEFGNRARKNDVIPGEEFRYLQQVFEKYTKLGGNDIAHDEYEFVRDYYNGHK